MPAIVVVIEGPDCSSWTRRYRMFATHWQMIRSTQKHANHFFADVHSFIAAIANRFPIHLAVIVGHPAMIGTGPLDGHAVESGLVIASTDPVAADVVGAQLLGFRPASGAPPLGGQSARAWRDRHRQDEVPRPEPAPRHREVDRGRLRPAAHFRACIERFPDPGGPMSSERKSDQQFDLIVVVSGSAGSSAATQVRARGTPS